MTDALAGPNNLPTFVTSFVGRDRERIAVGRLLDEAPIITLVGPGGAGKTRLARQVAAERLVAFPDGAWWAALWALTDPTLVPQAITDALGLAETPGGDPRARLLDHVRDRRLLLVLDGCEAVLEAAANMVRDIAAAAPHVRVLATSRVPLAVGDERVFTVPPLPTSVPAEHLTESDAVHLMSDRAAAARPGFSAGSGDVGAMAALCRRLDGRPLAIELTAAAVRYLSLADTEHRLAVYLAGAPATAEGVTTATIRFAADLLSEPQRRLLYRLSAFRGGWLLDDAGTVCAEGGGVDDEVGAHLAALVAAGLASIRRDGTEGEDRFEFHDAVLAEARAGLEATGDADELDRRHLAWCLTLAEEGERQRPGPEHASWLRRLAAEEDNIRAALDRAAAGRVPAEPALRLAGLMWWVWRETGHAREGAARLHALLAARGHGVSPLVRARALYAAAIQERRLARADVAAVDLDAALALARAGGDQQLEAWCLNDLSNIARNRGELVECERLLTESLRVKELLGDRWDVAIGMTNLAMLVIQQGDLPRARRILERNVALCRDVSNVRSLALSLNNLGYTELQLGEVSSAREHLKESLALFEAMPSPLGIAAVLEDLGMADLVDGDVASAEARVAESVRLRAEHDELGTLPRGLEYLARVAVQAGEPRRAVRLAGAADAWRSRAGTPLQGPGAPELRQALAEARFALGDAAHRATWVEGQHLPPEAAIAEALGAVAATSRPGR